MRMMEFWFDEEDFWVTEIRKVAALLSGTLRVRDLVLTAIATLLDSLGGIGLSRESSDTVIASTIESVWI